MAETCDGGSVACPADVLEPAGAVCRASTDLCDIEEACDGFAADCPADEFLPPDAVCSNDPPGMCIENVCVFGGVITIIKVSDPKDGTDFEFTCTDETVSACEGMGDASGMFTLDDEPADSDGISNTETSDPMPAGDYTIEEMVPVGWQLDEIICEDDLDGNSVLDADEGMVVIGLDPGEDVICTFFNSDIPVGINGFNNSSKMQVIKNRQNKINISGVTPGANVKLVWGFKKGMGFIGNGACAGTQVSIKPHQIIATLQANNQGNLNKTFFVPSTSSNKAFIQPMDMSSCMVGVRKKVTLLND